MKQLLIAAAGLTAMLAPLAPAAAQSADEKVNVVIVYGDDKCPVSTAEEIVVCPRLDERERFRIPTSLRANPNDLKNEAWTQRVKAYETVGASGINSCSPSGAGGFTGCTQQLVKTAYAEKAQGADVQAGRLVEEERRRRLARIDDEAEETEQEVRKIEAERAARENAAADEAGPDASALPQPK